MVFEEGLNPLLNLPSLQFKLVGYSNSKYEVCVDTQDTKCVHENLNSIYSMQAGSGASYNNPSINLLRAPRPPLAAKDRKRGVILLRRGGKPVLQLTIFPVLSIT